MKRVIIVRGPGRKISASAWLRLEAHPALEKLPEEG